MCLMQLISLMSQLFESSSITLGISLHELQSVFVLPPLLSVEEVDPSSPEVAALLHLQLQRVCRTQGQEPKALVLPENQVSTCISCNISLVFFLM